MSVYYNEIDKDAAAQLRAYIDAGLIAPGVVDERSIEDIAPNELLGYSQLHFFAGIGGWSYAMDLAGWPRGLPVITGSCPCQPFSQAGAGAGFADERHLWPAFWHIIRELRRLGHPAARFVFGEQVASPDALRWLDLVFDDLEGEGYACWVEDSCSASVGAPHIRQRLCWAGVGQADADIAGLEGWGGSRGGADQCVVGTRGVASGLAEPNSDRSIARLTSAEAARHGRPAVTDGGSGGVADALHSEWRPLDFDRSNGHHRQDAGRSEAHGIAGARSEVCRPSETNGFWRDADWLYCRDGKWRPVEPGTFPLAHGLPRSMGALGPELSELARVAGLSQQSLAEAKCYRVRQLKGYGNAINPWQAAEFVRAAMAHISSIRSDTERAAA